jgi:hypothetical protein
MKFKKVISMFLITGVLLVNSIYVFAETITRTPTHDGKTVTCKIAVDWHVGAADIANAYTSFTPSDLPNHTARVALYRQYDFNGGWEELDAITSGYSAHVAGNGVNVWQFRSEHYVVHTTGTQTTVNVSSITEW